MQQHSEPAFSAAIHGSWGRPRPTAVLALLLLLLPACATSTALTTDIGSVSASLDSAPVDGLRATRSANDREPAGVVRLGQPASARNPVRPAVLTIDSDDRQSDSVIVPLAHQAIASRPVVHSHQAGPIFTPSDERIDPSLGRRFYASLYPDEYLIDGGDRKAPVHYFQGQRQGFETEDTIAEYKDHWGKPHVRASTRVAVYSPRFGSVEVVEGAGADIQVRQAVKTTEVAGTGILERREQLVQSVKEDGMVAVGSRRRADGAETRHQSQQTTFATEAHEQNKAEQSIQARGSRMQEILERQLGAEYHDALANAAVWTRDLFPKLSASTSQATQVRARFTPQAVIGIEDKRAEQSEIHIVKLADREFAEAGDTIHFTIRFINTGDYDLLNVRIVDNLTPRLQFVPDSVNTNRAGDVVTEPNGEGSDIVTFEFDEPLPARQSGSIEFDVIVR